MNFKISRQPLAKLPADLILVMLFENEKKLETKMVELDKILNGQITTLIRSADFQGKLGESLMLFPAPNLSAPRLLLLGLGKRNEYSRENLRGAISAGSKAMQKYKIKTLAIALSKTLPRRSTIRETVQALTESLLLSGYKFSEYKKPAEGEEKLLLENIEFVLNAPKDRAAVQAAIKESEIIAQAVKETRDLGNHPSNVATPSHLASHALKLARSHKNIRVKILHRADIVREKMGALLAVARGSDEEPKFIILEYLPKKKAPTIVLAGKGITFDSGGINIKPSEKLEEMKFDMAGAATVMGVIQAASELKLPINLIGLIAATENLPSGKATKPGDIIHARSGKTIEIINTDAEGRLVLADALDYAKRYHPDAVIDFATLTGAIVVALGDDLIGTFTNTDRLLRTLQTAATATGEKIWPMPLEKTYEQFIKSEIADLRNIGTTRYGDSINAALFLENFVDYPWVHLDIAGVAWATREKPYQPKGATGAGVRLAIEFLKNFKRA